MKMSLDADKSPKAFFPMTAYTRRWEVGIEVAVTSHDGRSARGVTLRRTSLPFRRQPDEECKNCGGTGKDDNGKPCHCTSEKEY